MRLTTKTTIWFIWLLLSEFGFGLAIWWFFDTKWVLLIVVCWISLHNVVEKMKKEKSRLSDLLSKMWPGRTG